MRFTNKGKRSYIFGYVVRFLDEVAHKGIGVAFVTGIIGDRFIDPKE